MLARTVHLDVKKHAVWMLSELQQMKRDNIHCDLIIEVQNDVFYTHKNIMSAASDYFRAMLKHDTKESRQGRVNLKDVDSECVKNCIDFIYSGKFEIPAGKIKDLLHVAIMMQLEDIKQNISDILAESITVENYFSTTEVADMYGLDDVDLKCTTFFHENTLGISKQSQFGDIKKSDIHNLLKSKNAKFCEEEKLTISLRWAEKNSENLLQCLKLINYTEISVVYLQDLLESHPIVGNNMAVYKLLNSHLIKATMEIVETREDRDVGELIILFDNDTDCIRSFNPEKEKVKRFSDEKFKHLRNFSVICHDSYIYALCQNKTVHRINFQHKNSNWERIDDMICDHGLVPRSVSLLGLIFIIGGSYPKATSAVEIFDPSVTKWFQLEDKPTAISDASLVSLNDSVYCIGGIGPDNVAVSSFCRFTPFSWEWDDLEPMRYPVFGSGVVAVNQRIFVISRQSEMGDVNVVECYDVTLAHWTTLSTEKSYHDFNTTHHIGDWIYAVDELGTSDDIQKYEILNKKWSKMKLDTGLCFKIYRSVMVKL